MITEIKVPDLPESVSDATIAAWALKVGEQINEEDNLLELETDKVVLEVPAPVSGVLTAITAEEGVTVMAGDVIGTIDSSINTEIEQSSAEVIEPPVVHMTEPVTLQEPAIQAGPQAEAVQQQTPITQNQNTHTEPENKSGAISFNTPLASPSVRKTMAENSINGKNLNGSGKNGRILKEDVNSVLNDSGTTVSDEFEINQRIVEDINESSVNASDKPKVESINGQPVDSVKEKANTISVPTGDHELHNEGNERPERRVPMTRLRARIAERLLEVQQNAAILTTFNEVDLSEVSRLRKKYQDRFQKAHGTKLGFMSFFIKAATEALKRYPEVNARIDNGDIIYQGYYDIGVAVSSERGLVVPILRDTDTMGNADVEKVIADFGTRARAGRLELNELTGGTFSITNGGIFGSMLSTPILNPPQSAILGMHKIEERPIALNGEVVIRPMMYLALSYDHRIIDGQAAVSFLVKVKELLEDPASLFLEL